ncbi:MAG: TSUP family transporter, partial [Lysobacter sp.]
MLKSPRFCSLFRVRRRGFARATTHTIDKIRSIKTGGVVTIAVILFLALGAVAGVLAGLLGVGGGLVLVAALAWLLPTLGIPQESAMHAALASSLASIVLTAAASARAHAWR